MAEAKRSLLAILAADVVGYSRLMSDDERATLDALNACRQVFREHVGRHNGHVVDTAGDSVLAKFASVVEAVACALAVQDALAGRNESLSDARRMHFRIGVNLGDVIEQDDGTIYGDGVNVAAGLEGLAAPGGVMVSEAAYWQIEQTHGDDFVDAGLHEVKNIARPVRAFARASDTLDKASEVSTQPREDRKPTLALAGFDVVGGDQDMVIFTDAVRDAIAASFSNQTGIVLMSSIDEADYVASVRIQALSNRFRATFQVIDHESGRQFASDRFDGELDDPFEAQDTLAYRIYMSIRYSIYEREFNKDDNRPDNEQSNQALLSKAGYRLFGADPRQYAEARKLTDLVLERDSDDFMALTIKAYSLLGQYQFGYRRISEDDAAAALHSAHRAVQLNPRSDVAQSVLGSVLTACGGDLDTAEGAARRSLELNPSYTIAMWMLGSIQIYAGRPESGIALCRKALETFPRDPHNHRIMFYIGLGYFVSGDYRKSVEWARRSDQQLPNVARTLLLLTTAAANGGEIGEARSAATRLLEQHPDFQMTDLHRWPFRDAGIWDRFVDGLNQVGLNDPAHMATS